MSYDKYKVQFCQSGVGIVTEQINVVTVSNGKRKKKRKNYVLYFKYSNGKTANKLK